MLRNKVIDCVNLKKKILNVNWKWKKRFNPGAHQRQKIILYWLLLLFIGLNVDFCKAKKLQLKDFGKLNVSNKRIDVVEVKLLWNYSLFCHIATRIEMKHVTKVRLCCEHCSGLFLSLLGADGVDFFLSPHQVFTDNWHKYVYQRKPKTSSTQYKIK